jgi:NAD+ kinase
MKIALFGKQYGKESKNYIQFLIDELVKRDVQICCSAPFFADLKIDINLPGNISLYKSHQNIKNDVDFLFSIGGDGTILDAVPIVRDYGIPILGINLGRLGFLSSISKDEISTAIDNLFSGNYSIDQRTLLRLNKPENLFGDLNYALNDLTIYRNNTTSLITIHVWVDDVFLNTYWGDGLIISTPTGSTAYSMSVGGPIVTPGSENFVIAPIASHNLTVRPVVIPDSSVIKIKIQGREDKFLLTMDSRHSSIDKNEELIIVKEDFKIKLVQMPGKNFFSTIREKLLWGVDSRNYN